jgi:hypothetical protein
MPCFFIVKCQVLFLVFCLTLLFSADSILQKVRK